MSHTKLRLSSGSPAEITYGYSRAVKVGQSIFISGTTAMRDGEIIGAGDAAVQTRQAVANIRWALEQFDSGLDDIVRYRAYVTDLTQWESVAWELGEVFRDIRPAATLVGTSGLILPGLLVEIDADAVIGSGAGIDDLSPAI